MQLGVVPSVRDWILRHSYSTQSQLCSHFNSSGYNCCSARSKFELPARNFAALTTPSRPATSWSTMPIFHFPQFRSSSLISITSPTAMTLGFPACLRRCCSRSPRRYSSAQRRHIMSLHRLRCLARFRWSGVSKWWYSNSDRRLGCPNSNELGVRTQVKLPLDLMLHHVVVKSLVSHYDLEWVGSTNKGSSVIWINPFRSPTLGDKPLQTGHEFRGLHVWEQF